MYVFQRVENYQDWISRESTDRSKVMRSSRIFTENIEGCPNQTKCFWAIVEEFKLHATQYHSLRKLVLSKIAEAKNKSSTKR